MKLFIATSRDIGQKCLEWAKSNLPEGWTLSTDINDCDILISVLYEKLLTPDYLEAHKCFNFHPGILPEYRGAGTYSWAIVNGETQAGVTLHEIDAGIDSGYIIDTWKFPIDRDDTAEKVFRKAEDIIFDMFTLWFDKLLNGDFSSREQDEMKARIYYRKDLEKLKDLTKFIRALTFKGKESAYYYNSSGKKIYINYEETE